MLKFILFCKNLLSKSVIIVRKKLNHQKRITVYKIIQLNIAQGVKRLLKLLRCMYLILYLLIIPLVLLFKY